jgi:hypothetical protein
MKVKKEYLLLILIIAALSIYLAVQKTNHDDPELPGLAQLDGNAFNRMLITKADTSIELTKKDEQWLIKPQDFPANSATVTNMINAAAKLTTTALVSKTGIYDRYDLNSARRTTVKVFNGQALEREFSIGKTAPTFQHTFVLLAGDDNVYHARGNLSNTFNQTIESLRDKKVLSFEKDGITALEIKKGDQIQIISKKEITPQPEGDTKDEQASSPQPPVKTEWTNDSGQAVDSPAVDSLLNNMSGLTCDAFMADDAKSGLKDAAWTITFKSGQGDFTLSVFEKDAQTPPKYKATSSDSQYAFLLNENRVTNFQKNIDKLLGATPEKPSDHSKGES